MLFHFGHITGKGIELPRHRHLLPGQDIGQEPQYGITGIAARLFGEVVPKIDPYLIFPLIVQ